MTEATTDVNLLAACGIAFLAVMVLLSTMAGVMSLLTVLLAPRRAAGADPAIAALISTAVATHLPGARVTRIEEIKKP